MDNIDSVFFSASGQDSIFLLKELQYLETLLIEY